MIQTYWTPEVQYQFHQGTLPTYTLHTTLAKEFQTCSPESPDIVHGSSILFKVWHHVIKFHSALGPVAHGRSRDQHAPYYIMYSKLTKKNVGGC